MAAGNTALITQASFNQQLGADAAYLRSVYNWLKTKSAEYTVNAGSLAVLEAAPYSYVAADANAILVFEGDLARLITQFEGGTPAASNIVNDMASLLGVS